MNIEGVEDDILARRIGHFAGEGFVTDQIMPVPGGRHAPVIVTIDGLYYAGFYTRAAAKAAILLWQGTTDGVGRTVDQYKGCHWSAIQGKTIEIVGGGSDQ
jgi:hypothetical protein